MGLEATGDLGEPIAKDGKADLGTIAVRCMHMCLEKGSKDNMTVLIAQVGDGRDHNEDAEIDPGGWSFEQDAQLLEKYQDFERRCMGTSGRLCSSRRASADRQALDSLE